MSSRKCCRAKMPAGDESCRSGSDFRRGREAAGWLIPGITLALIPKCPLCVVGYVALATGLGISISTATYLRTGVIISCAVTLAGVAARQLCRLVSAVLRSSEGAE
jgi:hypothetical protein